MSHPPEVPAAAGPLRELDAHPPLWIFGCTMIAGAATPFVAVAMPFLLRRDGISVETIAGIAAVTVLPFTVMFAWAPVVDMLITRRSWVLAGNLASALLLMTAVLLPRPQYLGLFTAALFFANVGISLALMAVGGMMATSVPDRVRGKSAGWFQAGNFGSFALLGGASLWLLERMTLVHAAVAITLMSFLPALAILLVREPRRSLTPNRAVFVAMFREVRTSLSRREAWLGALIVVSPLGGGASYLLSGVGVDYAASPDLVSWVTGLPGGVIATVVGAFLGGLLSDRFPRRPTFIVCGGLAAVVSTAIALAPTTAVTYAISALTYQVVTAMVWASAYAFYLELSGTEPLTAATRVAIFTALRAGSNAYMVWADGIGNRVWGIHGMFAMDAVVVAVTVLACVGLVRTLGGPPLALASD